MRYVFKNHRLFIAAVIFYIFGVICYAWFEFHNGKRIGLQTIDEQLLKTVSLAEHLLQQELHGNLLGKQPLTPDEDFILSLQLQELAERMQVTYIYSLVKRDEAIVFISSNPAPEELNTNNYEMAFLMRYDDAPAALFEAFASGEVQFAQYSDQWGEFRSVFFPFKAATAETYVVAVDINSDEINQLAYQSLSKAIIYGLFLGVIAFPLVFIYLRTIQSHYEEKLAANQRHPLTALPNRRYLEITLDMDKEDLDQLLLIEIENFDYIASHFGVPSTDSLLIKLACRLQELTVEGIEHCQLFHLDDNQFAIYTNHNFSTTILKKIIGEAYRCLTESKLYVDDQQQVPLIVRMGAAQTQSSAFMLASMALIHAKNTNQSLVIYDPTLNLPRYFRAYVENFNLLTNALSNDRVRIYFQPILDVRSARFVKYEAFVRLYDETGQLVGSPDEFMPIAYQSRLCHKITRVVVKKVIQRIARTNHIVSINISVKDLFDQKTREFIIRAIRESGIGARIELELLEQQMISNYRLAAAYMTQLRSCVAKIGMDDLGKFYSNFDRLLSLPLDFVKIDGSIINAIERDSDARSIVEGVVQFAEQKGIEVIAKHCASQSVCDMVSLLNVNLLQGFHIGLPAETFDIQGDEIRQIYNH